MKSTSAADVSSKMGSTQYVQPDHSNNNMRVFSKDHFEDLVISALQEEKLQQHAQQQQQYSNSVTPLSSLSRNTSFFQSNASPVHANGTSRLVSGHATRAPSTSPHHSHSLAPSFSHQPSFTNLQSPQSHHSFSQSPSSLLHSSSTNSHHHSQNSHKKSKQLQAEEQERRRQALAELFMTYEIQKQDEEKKLKERIKKHAQQEEQKFNGMLAALDAEKEYVDSIESFLERHEQTQSRKKQQLYKEWTDSVFNPIQDQIQKKLAKIPVEDIERRRRELFQLFLESSNKKEGLFRDIIIESDYNPLAERSNVVTYTTSKLKDPLKAVLRKQTEEDATLDVSPVPSGSPLARTQTLHQKLEVMGRDTLLDASAHCYWYSTPENGAKPVNTRTNLSNKSSIMFDHYTMNGNA